MKLSGEGQAELIRIAVVLGAAGLAFWLVKRAAGAGLDYASDMVNSVLGVVDDLAQLPGQIVDSAVSTVTETRQAIADSNPTNPGYQLPAGWYRVKTRWGEVVTQHPDSFKTINPYDTLGLIDP